ncbi:hypothetical protein JW796_01325 [Candidatus Dojkabacteria bacterium]|nr:hypothetical protein [Candidatus Dojkabacteria bacterium]
MPDLDQGFEITNIKPFLVSAFGERKQFATLKLPDGSVIETVIKDVTRHCPDDVKNGCRGVIPPKWYLSVWEKYIEAGVNTHEWMGVADENNIIMPNLYAEGWRIYGRCFYGSIDRIIGKSIYKSVEKHNYAVPLSEQDLLATALGNEEIEAAVKVHVSKASDAGIVLPFDDPYELLVHNDGRWCIRTLDLSFTEIGTPENAIVINTRRIEKANTTIFSSIEILADWYNDYPEIFAQRSPIALSRPQ